MSLIGDLVVGLQWVSNDFKYEKAFVQDKRV